MRQLSWVAATMLSGTLAGPLAGQQFTVTTVFDEIALDGQCSLRQALTAAINDTSDPDCPTSPGADVIVLDAVGSYLLTQPLVIPANAAITLRGDGGNDRNSYALDGNNATRILDLQPDASATIQHVVLTHGFAEAGIGGAIRAQEADLVLRDATLSDNAAGDGGGLFWSTSGTRHLLVEDVLFADNRGTTDYPSFGHGGGAFVVAGGTSTVRMADITFFNNQATNSLGSNGAAGGMWFSAFGDAQVELVRADFVLNIAPGRAGGILLRTADSARVEMLDAVFSENTGDPAAIEGEMTGASSLRVGRTQLVTNLPTGSAAQAYFRLEEEDPELTLDNLLIADGPGVGLDVLLLDQANLLAGHLTIADNDVAGLKISDVSTLTPRIESSILWNNGPGGTNDLEAPFFPPPVFDGVLIGELGHPDPLFVDPANQDYELQVFSIARDQGNAAFATAGCCDAKHGPRVEGPAPDLGAFEHGGIFAWDAEEGDAGAWSETVPPSP